MADGDTLPDDVLKDVLKALKEDVLKDVLNPLKDVVEKNRQHECGFPQDTDYIAAGEHKRKKLAKENDAVLQRRLRSIIDKLSVSGLRAMFDLEGELRRRGLENLFDSGRPIRRVFGMRPGESI